jgi:hypothetical protein
MPLHVMEQPPRFLPQEKRFQKHLNLKKYEIMDIGKSFFGIIKKKL